MVGQDRIANTLACITHRVTRCAIQAWATHHSQLIMVSAAWPSVTVIYNASPYLLASEKVPGQTPGGPF